MTEEQPKTQPGASKNDFYLKVLDEAEKLDFAAALDDNSLDNEIALLKTKIKTLVEKDPDDLRLFLQATNMLAKLIKIRYSMNKKEENNLGEAIKNIIRDIGVPLGISIMNKKL